MEIIKETKELENTINTIIDYNNEIRQLSKKKMEYTNKVRFIVLHMIEQMTEILPKYMNCSLFSDDSTQLYNKLCNIDAISKVFYDTGLRYLLLNIYSYCIHYCIRGERDFQNYRDVSDFAKRLLYRVYINDDKTIKVEFYDCYGYNENDDFEIYFDDIDKLQDINCEWFDDLICNLVEKYDDYLEKEKDEDDYVEYLKLKATIDSTNKRYAELKEKFKNT